MQFKYERHSTVLVDFQVIGFSPFERSFGFLFFDIPYDLIECIKLILIRWCNDSFLHIGFLWKHICRFFQAFSIQMLDYHSIYITLIDVEVTDELVIKIWVFHLNFISNGLWEIINMLKVLLVALLDFSECLFSLFHVRDHTLIALFLDEFLLLLRVLPTLWFLFFEFLLLFQNFLLMRLQIIFQLIKMTKNLIALINGIRFNVCDEIVVNKRKRIFYLVLFDTFSIDHFTILIFLQLFILFFFEVYFLFAHTFYLNFSYSF